MSVGGYFETKKSERGKRLLRLLLWTLRLCFNLTLFFALAAMIAATAMYLYVIQDYRGQLDERYPVLPQNSFVYDSNGDQIAEFAGKENRITVGPDGVGKYLPQAVVAVEDRRFHEHAGVDFPGIARAAYNDLREWRVIEGGSTITEQLMKNLFISPERWGEASFRRRFTQASLSFAYERRHTKEEILTTYLNTVYFGDGAYGAEMAAKRYFGKSAKDLSLSEAAALAGFLHAPSTYLSENGESWRATERRDEVLELMEGQGMISASQRREAASEPVEFSPDSPPDDPVFDPFVERVRREIEDKLGSGAIERGGLRIQTTLDPEMQREAADSTQEILSEPDDPSGGVATVVPQNGAIQVLAGEKDDFNLALDARRQPGSAFKPFVLAAALREDISPETRYVSQDLSVHFGDQDYTISNYDLIERGEISVAEAMAESDNTVFVQLAADVGFEDVADTAEALGLTTEVDPYPSTAIGGLEEGVSPLDMASAYATFAAGGVYREPYSVERVERVSFGESEAVYDHRTQGRRVMSGNEAATLTQVLRGVVESGTASRYHDLDEELGRPSAGKTGTTEEFADAWYVGYTPRLSTAVWVGYPDARRSMTDVHGLEEVNGETLPLDLWALYMSRATSGEPVLKFPDADEDEFEVLQDGYAVSTPAQTPHVQSDPTVPALGDLGDSIQAAVDRALEQAFGGR